MALSLFQLQLLYLGGSDGGVKQDDGDGAVSSLECHVLQITSDCTFTTLTAVDKNGDDVNMVTVNNYDAAIIAPATICAPDLGQGGYIKAITLSAGQLLRHTLPNTKRSA